MIDRALTQGLFYCPKGAYTVWATVFSVAQTVKSVAQIVFSLSATVGFHLLLARICCLLLWEVPSSQKNSQTVSRQATKPFFTQRGSSVILCFALRLLVVFIENIRNPIKARNGGLPHSSLTKRRIFEYKDTNFWSKYTLFNKKTRL